MKIIKVQCKTRVAYRIMQTPARRTRYSETKHASPYNALLFEIYDGTHENGRKGWSRIPLRLLSYRDL